MDPAFWKTCWEEGRTGWHLDDVNQDLQVWWEHAVRDPSAAVFVPLCGRSKDLTWLRDRGHTVTGVELSPIAVSGLFADERLEPEVTQDGVHELWSSPGMRIYLGDFFALTADQAGAPAAWYDRAACVALPAEMRPGYVDHLRRLLPTGARGLLITLDFPEDEKDGPPFPQTLAEVEALYADGFRLETVAENDILDKEPRFQEAGLTMLLERVHILERT